MSKVLTPSDKVKIADVMRVYRWTWFGVDGDVTPTDINNTFDRFYESAVDYINGQKAPLRYPFYTGSGGLGLHVLPDFTCIEHFDILGDSYDESISDIHLDEMNERPMKIVQDFIKPSDMMMMNSVAYRDDSPSCMIFSDSIKDFDKLVDEVEKKMAALIFDFQFEEREWRQDIIYLEQSKLRLLFTQFYDYEDDDGYWWSYNFIFPTSAFDVSPSPMKESSITFHT